MLVINSIINLFFSLFSFQSHCINNKRTPSPYEGPLMPNNTKRMDRVSPFRHSDPECEEVEVSFFFCRTHFIFKISIEHFLSLMYQFFFLESLQPIEQ